MNSKNSVAKKLKRTVAFAAMLFAMLVLANASGIVSYAAENDITSEPALDVETETTSETANEVETDESSRDCVYHHYLFSSTYGEDYVDGECPVCKEVAHIRLHFAQSLDSESKVYYYTEGMTWSDIVTEEWIDWDKDLDDGTDFAVYYSSETITGPGKYKLGFRYFYGGDLMLHWDFTETEVWIKCQTHDENSEYEYVEEDGKLVMRCKACGEEFNSIEIVLDDSLDADYDSGKYTWSITDNKSLLKKGNTPLSLNITSLNEESSVSVSDNLKLIYEVGKGKYSFDCPTTFGEYTAYIALLKDASDASSAIQKSCGIEFVISPIECKAHDASHDYSYSVKDGALVQVCDDCGSTVRTYSLEVDESKIKDYASESTYTWSTEEISYYGTQLSPFSLKESFVIGDATEKSKPTVRLIYETKTSGVSSYSFSLPSKAGTYSVYAAVLKDSSDVNSVISKGKLCSFAIKGAIEDECKEYTVLTINSIPKQKVNGGYYSYDIPAGKYILNEDLNLGDGYLSCMRSGTTIYLNGHTIYGTIKVYANTTIIDDGDRQGKITQLNSDLGRDLRYAIYVENAALTLTNVNVCDCNCGGLSITNNSTVKLNNCTISNINSWGRCAMAIYDSTVYLTNTTVQQNKGSFDFGAWCTIGMGNSSLTLKDSKIINNNENTATSAIYMSDGNQTLKLTGSTYLSGNATAISAGTGNKIYILDETKVTGNNVAGLLIRSVGTDGVKLLFSTVSDDDIDIDIKFSAAGSKSASDYLVCCSTNKSAEFIKNAFNRNDGGNIAKANGGSEAYFYLSTEYIVSGETISAHCADCKADGSATLSMGSYDGDNGGYTEGSDISKLITIEKNGWDDEHIKAYPTIVYGYMNSVSGKIEKYSTTAPSQKGVYTVKLSLLLSENDLSTEYVSTEETYFTVAGAGECNHDEIEYFCEDNNITIRCADCYNLLGTAHLVNASGEISELFTDGDTHMLYMCCDDELDIDYGDGEDFFDELSIVYGYTQANGKIKYSLKAPTEPCTFTAYVALLEDDNNPNSDIIKTDSLQFELAYHRWEYTADDRSLYADCEACNQHASVTLFSEGADYASRHFDADAAEEYFDYDICTEENWTGQNGIEQYYILYDGEAINTEFDTTLKNDVFYKPTISGNYTARIVLLSDVSKPKSVYLTTDEMPYYLSGLSLGDPYLKITDYTENQYKLLTAPKFENSAYQVGTLDELLWVARNCTSENINITNDIVFNPITVSDDGDTVRCGSVVIYSWLGLGNSYTGTYTGNIYGNGHTIYGLYSKGESLAGLILTGCNNSVYDLTISDSVISAIDCAGGIAALEISDSGSANVAELNFKDCKVLNSLIYQTKSEELYRGVGGVIGKYWERGGLSKLTLENCIVSSNISGEFAGGFIGEIEQNYSYWQNGRNLSVYIENCRNLGNVSAEYVAGGFIGSTGDSGSEYYYINNSVNAGTIEGNYTDLGGFIGRLNYIKESNSVLTNCTNIGKIYEENGSDLGAFFGEVNAAKFGTCSNNNYYGAEKIVGSFNNAEESDFGAKLLTESEAKEVLASVKLPSYEKESNNSSVASVFSEASVGIYVMAGILVLAAVMVIFKAKKAH